jgi:hypothetical protein
MAASIAMSPVEFADRGAGVDLAGGDPAALSGRLHDEGDDLAPTCSENRLCRRTTVIGGDEPSIVRERSCASDSSSAL